MEVGTSKYGGTASNRRGRWRHGANTKSIDRNKQARELGGQQSWVWRRGRKGKLLMARGVDLGWGSASTFRAGRGRLYGEGRGQSSGSGAGSRAP